MPLNWWCVLGGRIPNDLQVFTPRNSWRIACAWLWAADWPRKSSMARTTWPQAGTWRWWFTFTDFCANLCFKKHCFASKRAILRGRWWWWCWCWWWWWWWGGGGGDGDGAGAGAGGGDGDGDGEDDDGIDWLDTDWLIDWLIDLLIDWLVDGLIHWLISFCVDLILILI